MPPPVPKICDTCAFFEQPPATQSAPFGTCHRYAPPPTTETTSSTKVAWPSLKREDWCGDWAKGPF